MLTYKQLYGSYLKCRKNKRNTINQLAFEIDAEQNLLRLEEELNARTYRPSRSICFVVDRPKLREIFDRSATRESIMSYLGHFKHANAYRLTQNLVPTNGGLLNDLPVLS